MSPNLADLLFPLATGGDDVPPLVLVPSAAATPFSFMPLAQSLGSKRPVIGLAYAGLENRLPAHTDMKSMVEDYCTILRSHYPQGACVIAGHCWGGAIALEIARQLRAMGDHDATVVLLDTLPPISVSGRQKIRDHSIQALKEQDTLEAIVGFFREIENNLDQLPERIAGRYRDSLRNQLQLVQTYSPEPFEITIRHIRTATLPDKLFQAWQEVVSNGNYQELQTSGNTFSMLTQPYVRRLATLLDSI
jgi:thioesterase domain-containing protein